MPKQIISRGGINREMLIYNSQSFISPVARQYFAKVNALGGDVQNKKAINDFVIRLSGVVNPNLWACWPLRSSQSIGSGVAVPSLGLLGNYPGVLLNGPTWHSDGLISTNGANQSVSVSNFYNLNGQTPPATFFAVQYSDYSGVTAGIPQWIGTATAGMRLVSNGLGSNRGTSGRSSIQSANINPASFGTQLWRDAQYTIRSTGGQVFVAGASVGTQTLSGATFPDSTDTIFIGMSPQDGTGSVTTAFAIFILADINPTLLRDIYKQTLGLGLSLP